MLRGKFIALNVYIGKKEKPKISNLNFYFRTLEKEEQIKSKVSRRKDVIKILANRIQQHIKRIIHQIGRASCRERV